MDGKGGKLKYIPMYSNFIPKKDFVFSCFPNNSVKHPIIVLIFSR
jgi:hypothetical protein